MKRLFIVSLGLLFMAIPSRAQGSVDASVGYSYFHLGGGADLNQNGVSGSLAYNPIPFMGAVADIGGYHATTLVPNGAGGAVNVSVNTYTFLFGPRISLHNPTNITPFAQFLVGDARVSVGSGGGSTNNFAYSVGGGVDFKVLPHLALRPQVDYIGVHNYNSGGTANCPRISISAVVHF